MVLVRPYFFEKRERRRRDLLQQKSVRPIEIEQCWKLGADLLADRVERHRIGHQPVEGKEDFVGQAWVTLVWGEGGHQLRGERREFHRLNLIDELPCQEAAQT